LIDTLAHTSLSFTLLSLSQKKTTSAYKGNFPEEQLSYRYQAVPRPNKTNYSRNIDILRVDLNTEIFDNFYIESVHGNLKSIIVLFIIALYKL